MKNLRTIRADSLAAALVEVRRTLGADATILHTRTVERRSLLGLRRRRDVEVIAASANFGLPAAERDVMLPRVGRPRAAAEVPAEGAAAIMPVATDEATEREVRRMRAEIDELKELVERLPSGRVANGPQCPAELRQTRISLLANEVADEIVDELIGRLQAELPARRLRDAHAVQARLTEYIAAMLPAGGEIASDPAGCGVVTALVGATGVGKTTTIAKLAADCVIRRRVRVGIVSLDGERPGAIEPLRAWAEILGVPLRSARDSAGLAAALAELRDCSVVLIDTAGCNPADGAAVAALATLLRGAGGCDVHLVLPVSASRAVLRRTLAGFAALGFGRLLFTKLDEAVGCGVILECMRRTRARLSYLTDGRDIAGNIAVGAPRRLAQRMLAAAGRPAEEGSAG